MAKGDWWLKLEIHTWLNDPKVRKLKRENRDTWLTACMLMTLDGSAELSGTPDELRNALHLTLTEFYDFVHDLENTNTADVTRCHAVSRNGLELVTLKSRRYARELSIKEKNRLRKQKERGHADVTPDSRDRVKSKELEVREEEEKEKEEEREKTPPEPKSILLFREFFPDQKLTPFHLDIIETRILDFERWRRALTDWKANSWSQKNVGNILNYYDELEGKQNGTNQKSSANHYRLADELERQGLAERAEAERRLLSGGDTHNHESDLVS